MHHTYFLEQMDQSFLFNYHMLHYQTFATCFKGIRHGDVFSFEIMILQRELEHHQNQIQRLTQSVPSL